MAGKFQIKQARNKQFLFNLKASNGRVILTSELYKTRAAAEEGISSVQKHARKKGSYERRETSSGEPYFVLKASNGEIIGTSESYSSNGAMENGIASVQKNIVGAKIIDE